MEWFVVSHDRERITLRVSPPGREAWDASFLFSDIVRVLRGIAPVRHSALNNRRKRQRTRRLGLRNFPARERPALRRRQGLV